MNANTQTSTQMSIESSIETSSWAMAAVPRGLHVLERGRVLRSAEASSLSSRARAGALAEGALAGAPPTARSLVLELDQSHGLCVLAMGDRPAAVWRFELGALRELATRLGADTPRIGALAELRAEASRIILGMRLAALRGSVGNVVVVHGRPNALSRFVGSALLEAIVEHVWRESDDLARAEASTRVSWREGGECRSA
jgi:hypothetical protein